MTSKPFDLKALARDISIIAGVLGAIGSGAMLTGSVSASTPQSDATGAKLEIHTATDSVRWVYTEARLVRMEIKIDQLLERVK